MTPDQKRQLDRMIRMQRLKVVVPLVAAAVIVCGAIVWMTAARTARLDATVERHAVTGHVLGKAVLTGRRGGFQVHVRLDDGHEVDAVSQMRQPPYPGEAIELAASTHASGRVTYQVVRLKN